MRGSKRIEWPVVVMLAVLAFVNAICWAKVIPPGEAPDEAGHYEVVAFESVFGRIPEFGVDDYGAGTRVALDGYRTPYYAYSAQPGLAYFASAVAVRLLGELTAEPYLAARYPGALWAALMTLVVFAGTRAMFPRERGAALLAAVFATCWPQLTLVFSYTNNDGLTTLVCAALVGHWHSGNARGWRTRDVILLGLLAGIVLLNKPNGFLLVGASILVLLTEVPGGWVRRARAAAVAGGVALATAGWWYLEAYSRYGWDLFAAARAESMREGLGAEWASARHFGLGLFETAYGEFPLYGEPWIVGTLRSAVGVLGEMTVHLPGGSYVLVGSLSLSGLIGFAVLTSRRGLSGGNGARFDATRLISLGLLPALLLLSLYRSWSFDYQAQGRYLFPAMLPFLAVVSAGLVGPLRGWWRGVAGLGASVSLFLLATDTFVVRLLRMYDQTFGDFWSAHTGAATSWVLALIGGLAGSILCWVRLAGEPEDPGLE